MRFDVTTPDGTPAGELEITAAGVRTGLEYKCDTLYPPSRLVLRSEAGVLPAGVPLPRDGGMAMSRRLTPLELAGFDLSLPLTVQLVPVGDPLPGPVRPAPETPDGEAPAAETPPPSPPPALGSEPVPEPESKPEPEPAPTPPPAPEPPPSGWVPEPEPSRFFSDPDMAASAGEISGALRRSEGADTLLAFPFSPSRPFPMLPAFRFGSAEEIGGEPFLVFRVRDGLPI